MEGPGITHLCCICREDHALAQGLSEDAAQTLWREVASAAESGWDFSSRWFQGKQGLKSIRTTQIIPVELNVFLWNLERVLSKWMASAGDEKGQQQVSLLLGELVFRLYSESVAPK